MGVFDSLFSGGTQTTQTKPQMMQAAKDLSYPGLDVYKALFRSQLGIAQNQQYQRLAQTAQQGALNPLQHRGLDQMVAQAEAANPLAGAAGTVGGLIGSGGMTPQAAGVAQNLTSGGYVNPAMAGVSHIASGADVGQNPYIDQAYQQAAKNFRQATIPGMDSSFAQAGRLGSNSYANALGQNVNQPLSQMATSMYGKAYDSERQNQMSALGLEGQLGQQDVNNALAGAGLYDQGVGRQLQGVGLGSTAYGLGGLGASQLYGVGSIEQQAPYQMAQNAVGVASGLPTGSSSTSGSQMNPITGLLGMGMGVAGIANLMGYGAQQPGQGGNAGPYSDERLKRKVRKVGAMPVYDWRYKGDPSGVLHRGPMAQDVAKVMPEKVGIGPGGFMTLPVGMVR